MNILILYAIFQKSTGAKIIQTSLVGKKTKRTIISQRKMRKERDAHLAQYETLLKQKSLAVMKHNYRISF
jgi:hypothetical protein